MKFKACNASHQSAASGFTLVEMMTSAGVGLLLLLFVVVLFINGTRSFIAMGNYQNLDSKSTTALDVFSKEIRNANQLLAYTTGVSIVLTNSTAGTRTTITYNAAAGTVVMSKTGQTDQTNLTGCDSWSFLLYDRNPHFSSTNITFSTTNATKCKLISMTWKCSRTILGSKVNTESVQTAQVVLRNKVGN